MCNINVAFRKDKVDDYKLSVFMNTASWNSFQRNRDAEGFFSLSQDGEVSVKGKNKLRYDDLIAYFICSHQRISTSGFGEDMAHPHETKDLLVVHNGVFSGLGDKDKSDTRVYTEKLQEEFTKCKDLTEAIKTVNRDLSGSFSVVVYNKNTKEVVYFKEDCSSMYKLEDEQYLIMSTIKENLEFAQFFLNVKGAIKEVNANKIYDVLNGFKRLSKFKKKAYVVPTIGYNNNRKYDSIGGYWDGYDKYKFSKEEGRWITGEAEAERAKMAEEWKDIRSTY